jgi:hypothetical protein
MSPLDPARAALAARMGYPRVCVSCGAGCDLLGLGPHQPGCTHPAAGVETVLELAQRTLPELPAETGVAEVARRVLPACGPDAPEGALALWVLALLPIYHAARDLNRELEWGAYPSDARITLAGALGHRP